MKLCRHYLVEITNQGRLDAYQNLGSDYTSARSKLIEALIMNERIPGILRRAEEGYRKQGTVAVGFSSPQRYGKGQSRLRVPAFVPREEITKITSSYQVLMLPISGRTPCLNALQEAKELAAELNIELGAWGSAGLEVYTGLPYTDHNSDLDLLVRGQNLQAIEQFYFSLKQLGEKYNCRLDPELDLPNGYGVKLSEFFMHTTELLGKSMKGVGLIPKQVIVDMFKN